MSSIAEEQAVENDVASSTEAVLVSKPTKRTPKRRKPVQATEEEEDSENGPAGWPFGGSRGNFCF